MSLSGASTWWTIARILVIDDHEPTRRVVRAILEGAGHSVLEASDGREGLTAFRKEPLDVVITDIVMPERDGLEVTMLLRRQSSKVRIVVLSGQSGDLDYLEVAKLLGAHYALRKPVVPAELLEAVKLEVEP